MFLRADLYSIFLKQTKGRSHISTLFKLTPKQMITYNPFSDTCLFGSPPLMSSSLTKTYLTLPTSQIQTGFSTLADIPTGLSASVSTSFNEPCLVSFVFLFAHTMHKYWHYELMKIVCDYTSAEPHVVTLTKQS